MLKKKPTATNVEKVSFFKTFSTLKNHPNWF